MGFVEEEDQFRLVRIPHFRELFEQFRQQPQQEGGIEFRAVDEAGGVQHAHDTASVGGGAHHVAQFQGRFTFALHDQQVALQGAQRGRGDVAIFLAEFVADFLVAHMGEQFAEVFQVQQQEAVIVGIFEGDVQHTFLRIGQPHQAG